MVFRRQLNANKCITMPVMQNIIMYVMQINISLKCQFQKTISSLSCRKNISSINNQVVYHNNRNRLSEMRKYWRLEDFVKKAYCVKILLLNLYILREKRKKTNQMNLMKKG